MHELFGTKFRMRRIGIVKARRNVDAVKLTMMLASAAADGEGPSVARSIYGDRWITFNDYPTEALNERPGGVGTVVAACCCRGREEVDACNARAQQPLVPYLDTVTCRLMGH